VRACTCIPAPCKALLAPPSPACNPHLLLAAPHESIQPPPPLPRPFLFHSSCIAAKAALVAFERGDMAALTAAAASGANLQVCAYFHADVVVAW